MADYESIVKYLFEAGELKRVKRSGWWMIGVKDPESVAEHCFRSAVIGCILGNMEKVDAGKVLMMCLFHDMHESRINDLHKVGHRYIDFRKAEKEVAGEQLKLLPKELASEVGDAFFKMHGDSSREGSVAKDADLLEAALQAREYIVSGYADAQDWINNIWKCVKTESAKKLLKAIEKGDPNSWWKGLKKIER